MIEPHAANHLCHSAVDQRAKTTEANIPPSLGPDGALTAVQLSRVDQIRDAARTLATENTAWPFSGLVLLLFSLASSSASDRPGNATALS